MSNEIRVSTSVFLRAFPEVSKQDDAKARYGLAVPYWAAISQKGRGKPGRITRLQAVTFAAAYQCRALGLSAPLSAVLLDRHKDDLLDPDVLFIFVVSDRSMLSYAGRRSMTRTPSMFTDCLGYRTINLWVIRSRIDALFERESRAIAAPGMTLAEETAIWAKNAEIVANLPAIRAEKRRRREAAQNKPSE